MKLLIVLAAICAYSLPQQTRAAEVTVHLKLVSPQELEVIYSLPEKCDAVPFLNQETLPTFGTEIRSAWQPLDDCGTANGTTLIKKNKTCSAVRFRVPASIKVFDRVSPGSFPIGDGLYVHTTSYAISDSCGSVGYKFSASGDIAFKGKVYRNSASYDEFDGQYLAAILLQKKILSNDGAISYFDPALGIENIQLLQDIIDQSMAFYRLALPDLHFRKPILVATGPKDGGDPYYWGDAGDVLRLALYNWPQHPTGDVNQHLKRFVWHELAHRFQPHSADSNMQTEPFISEGGADYLRWIASIKTKWVTPEDAAKEINSAISNCVFKADNFSWKTLPEKLTRSGSMPYECGLALHVMGLAIRQNNISPLQQINDYYSALETGTPISFEQAIECGKEKNCTPKWLPKLLGTQTLSEVWSDFFANTQLAKVTPPPPEQFANIRRMAFANLMQEDCHGNISFYQDPDMFRVGAIQDCSVLREGMQIKQIEGKDFFGTSLHVEEMNLACQSRGNISLGMQNAETIIVPCKSIYKIPTFYSVDMKRLMQKLDL